MIDLDPSCLRAFLAVVEAGGFTRAAAKLNRTQSAISMQIRRLEEALDTRLIEDRKKATLTAAGERILEPARRMLLLNDEMVGRAKGVDIAGRVRIGTPALTSRGMGEKEMRTIAGLMADVLSAPGDEAVTARVRNATRELCRVFPLYPELK